MPTRSHTGYLRLASAAAALALAACQGEHIAGSRSAPEANGLSRTSASPAGGRLSTRSPAAGRISHAPDAGALGLRAPGPVGGPLRTVAVGDTSPRIVWTNTTTGERSIWLMNGTSYSGNSVNLPTVSNDWKIAASADFSGDGQADLVWQNTTTGDRSLWVMSGNAYSGTAAALPFVSTDWQIAATADFNGDGHPDIVWQNLSTGDRSIWLMNGTAYTGTHAELPWVPVEWQIVSTADFNGDGKPDIVWQNVKTGDRSIWIMNGYTYSGTHSELPTVPVEWSMVSTADFNGDGKPDILWQNTSTGERSIWIMNGITYSGGHSDLPTVPLQWQMSTTMPKLASSTTAASACDGFATPRTMQVGEVVLLQGVSSACFSGTGSGSEYALVATNSDTAAATSSTISGVALGSPPASIRYAPSPILALRGGSATPLVEDVSFHQRLLRESRTLVGGLANARRLRIQPAGPRVRRSQIPASPQVGALIQVNVNANQGCTNPIYHTARIVSVGSKSVVLADTLNPSGGFTTADYDKFAARFDTLVYPLDAGAFGAPTDIDGNGRVGILFTRAVNELTPANNPSYIGGFFYGRDLLPRSYNNADYCPSSNEGEMFYMLAPDPNGQINGNVRSTALVDGITTGTIAHEFQHLINFGRRTYISPALDYEQTWMDEGLAHVAEELLYYRQSGKQPRQNLTDAVIRGQGATLFGYWKDDASQNFQRFSEYLGDPANYSPRGVDDSDDELATRGATWSFLRYAADRFYTSDGDVWYRLVNGTYSGLANIKDTFGTEPVPLFRDWSVANYMDDNAINTDPRYQHPSWNFHDIYTKTFTRGVYPLTTTGLTSGATNTASIQRISAAYYRFAVPANTDGLVKLAATGSAPNAAMAYVVIRTK